MNVILILISTLALIEIRVCVDGNKIISSLEILNLPNQTLNDLNSELEFKLSGNYNSNLKVSGRNVKNVKRSLSNYDRQTYVNEVIELSCELTSYYGSRVMWRKKHGRLSDESIERDGKLIISYLKQQDSGEYECFTKDGRASSVRLDVLNRVVDNNYNSGDNIIVFGEADSNVQLRCYLNSNLGQIKWRRVDGKILSEYSRDYGNYLLIYYLSEEDSGYYECYTANGQYSRSRLIVTSHDSNIINIPYNNMNHIFPSTTTITTTSFNNHQTRSNVEAYVDSNIELQCDLSVDDEFNIKWKRLNGDYSHYTREYGRRLFIYYLKEEDSGDYECYLDDGRSNLITLIVKQNYYAETTTMIVRTTNDVRENKNYMEQRNYHLMLQTSMEKELDENVEFNCRLNTDDESEIKWKKLNGPFSYYTRDHGRTLFVYYITENDAGTYECSLPNGQFQRFYLTVKLKAQKTTTPNINSDNYQRRGDVQVNDYYEQNIIEKDVDSNVELSCNMDDVNPNEIKWRRYDGVKLSENSREYGGKLLIYYLRVEDSADYECYTRYGHSNHIRLIVKSYESHQDRNENNDETIQLVSSIDKEMIELSNDNKNNRNNYVENTCTGKTSSQNLRIEWYDPNGNKIMNSDNFRILTETTQSNPLQITSKIYIYKNDHQHYGTYECRLLAGVNKKETKRFELKRNNNKMHELQVYRAVCDENQATCTNGQCISRSGLCDGKTDCSDGSDESNCGARAGGEGYEGSCQPNERPCHNKKCIQKIWFCDGEKDCEDGSDEISCSVKKPGQLCKSDEFMCKNRNQCIFKSFQCDREFDCIDKSDEIGCEVPRISKNPVRNLTVRLGGTFKIECSAEGFPSPYINWRLNWGHTCEEPRCYSTNEDGHGTFTVTNTQFTDQGAYSCEAINSEGRIFAVPDTIVYVIIPPTLPPPTSPPESDCMCYNHSDDCTCSGRCLNCQHNTEGDMCQYCKPGYYGDAKRGTPFDCVLYTTTTTRRTTTPRRTTTHPLDDCHCNNHSIDCTCDGYCVNCQHNTKGDRCQYCADGFVGDASRGTPYDCVPIGQYFHKPTCNSHGTAKMVGEVCRCKYGVTGRYCDQCAARSFHLVTKRDYKRGCLACFCNGLDVECHSSNKYYGKIESDFYREGDSWYITDKFTNMNEHMEIINNNAIEFSRFNQFKDYELFLIPPAKFKGNKLSSYGGNITISFKFDVDDYYILKKQTHQQSLEVKNLDLRISGSRINIYYYHTGVIQAKAANRIVIPLIEDSFKRYGDDGKVNREHMLMALSNIDLIMIRASYVASQRSIILSEFSMDSADHDNHYNKITREQASSVEVCECPEGYTGLSCESCAYGYRRSNRGFYLGLCEKYGYF